MSKLAAVSRKEGERHSTRQQGKCSQRHVSPARLSGSDSESALSHAEQLEQSSNHRVSHSLAKSLEAIRAEIKSSKEEILERIDVMSADIRELGGRVEDLEARMDDQGDQLNTAETCLTQVLAVCDDLQYKIDDLENRGRRKNLRFRGVLEARDVEDVPAIVRFLCGKLIGAEQDLHEGTVERAHRALKKQSDNRPRDIIARFASFAFKEKVMQCARQLGAVEYNEARVGVFQDLLLFTLAQRRAMKPALDILSKEKIIYRWAFPFALCFAVKDAAYRVRHLSEAWKKLHEAGLTPLASPPVEMVAETREKLQKLKRVSHKEK